MQIDAEGIEDAPPDVVDQRPDVGGRGARIGLDEVRMLLRHGRRSNTQPFAAGGLDQPTGGVTGRVGEDRATVGAARLMLATPPHNLGHLTLDEITVGAPPARVFEPVAASTAAHAPLYAEFVHLAKSQRLMYRRLNARRR